MGLGSPSAQRAQRSALTKALYRSRSTAIRHAPALRLYSDPESDPASFQIALQQAARERRDVALEKVRKRYSSRLTRLRERIEQAQAREERESEQRSSQQLQTAISIGATLLGALLGRRSLGSATTAARGVGRVARESADVKRAQDRTEQLRAQLEELELEFREALDSLTAELATDRVEVRERTIRALKSDIEVETIELVWLPWRDRAGTLEPCFQLE